MKNESKKRIVKNSGILYLRMFAMMGITLYTSRLILQALGTEDFGLYTLIAGVVAVFSALRNLFASSTQRFLNYEMGRGNSQMLSTIFSMSINIHIIIGLVFCVVVEIVGVYLISSYLNIPSEQLSTAYWILHFSVLTAFVSMMTTPFDAVLIAHEKMSVYAILSIIETVLKLVIVFFLFYNSTSLNNLQLYSVLIFFVSVTIRLINSIYCRKNFKECKYKYIWDKKLFRELGKFAGWNFVGSMAYSLSYEGINMLLNVFGGVVLNAARGLTMQVQGLLLNFVRNIGTAGTPQITKAYATNNKNEYFELLYNVGKYSFFILLLVEIPLFFFMKPLLSLWLADVPPYTDIFCSLTLIFLLFRVPHDTLDILYKASGKLKIYMLIDAFFFILKLVISYICLKSGAPFYSPFIVIIVIEIVNNIFTLVLAKETLHLEISVYMKSFLYPCFKVLIISGSVFFFLFSLIDIEAVVNVWKLFALLLCCFGLNLLFIISLGLSKKEKSLLKKTLMKNIK